MSGLAGASGQTLLSLPLEEWESTKETFHRYAQIVGKVRLGYAPYRNHWWHVPLYVSTRGLTTSPIPYDDVNFEISFDLLDNRLETSASDGGLFSFTLDDLPVAEFYRRLFEGLGSLGVDVSIDPKPFDLDDEQALDENTSHGTCDREYTRRYWQVLAWVDQVFKEFSGRFIGKQSPVQLYWHSFDLAVTRFSGHRAPERPNADRVTHQAYSHEVISFGFWPGDRQVREPAFYSYTAPESEGLTDQPLKPGSAFWTPEGGTALLMYEDVRRSGSPKETLLEFLQSAYKAGARTASWDMEEFEGRPVA